MRSSLARVALLFAAATTALLALGSPAYATVTSEPVADQCLVKVTGVKAGGEMVLGPQTCYTSYSEVLRAAGAKNPPKTFSSKQEQSRVAAAASIIGTHYDGANLTGASFTVQGSDCNGGGINVPLAWNDKISSTLNGCGTIIHYADTNFAGATGTTSGYGGNLTSYMNNATSSIRYFN